MIYIWDNGDVYSHELERNPSYYLDESDRLTRRAMDLAVKFGLPIAWE